MSEWLTVKLGDVITLKRGYDLPERDRIPGNVPIVSSSGISGYHNEAKVKAPGVVTGRYGTLGEIYYLTEDFWPHNTTLYVKDFKGNHPQFISYFLRSIGLASQSGAAAVPGVNRNHLHMIKVTVPDPQTQRRIAAILSAYDDLIENNTRRIQSLEQAAHDLYREWFVEFRFPGHESVEMVDSGTDYGMVPHGWEVVRLENVIELAYGKSLKADDRIAGDFPVYGSSGVVGSHNEYLVEAPGIIVGRKGNVGSVFWATKNFYPIDTVYYVNTELSLHYVFFNLKRQNFINNDAAVPGLSRRQAYSLPVMVPSAEALNDFDGYIEPMFEEISILIEKNNVLREARDLLLPRLVSGKLSVDDVESIK